MSRPKEELPVRSTTRTNLYFVTIWLLRNVNLLRSDPLPPLKKCYYSGLTAYIEIANLWKTNKACEIIIFSPTQCEYAIMQHMQTMGLILNDTHTNPDFPPYLISPWAENWVDSCFACNAFGSSRLRVCDIASLKRAMWTQHKHPWSCAKLLG